jgi:hypothetical protein
VSEPRKVSRPQLGSADQLEATSLPRYSDGGAGGAGHAGWGAGGQASGGTVAATTGFGAATLAVCSGGLAHAASNRQIVPAHRPRDNEGLQRPCEENAVGWVLLEVGAAIAIAALIVWWTFPKAPRNPPAEDREGPGREG